MIYLELFWCFAQVGMLCVGGGHAALPMVQAIAVEQRGWLTLTEFSDMIAISEITPGAFAVKVANFVGVKMAGVPGGIAAMLGCLLPSMIIVITLAHFYKKYRRLTVVSGALYGIRPAVTAMIASAGLSVLFISLFGTNVLTEVTDFSWIAAVLLGGSYLILRIKKPNPILVILASGALGVLLYSVF